MKNVKRLQRFEDEPFDTIILKIRRGEIKCGKYSNLVKINKEKTLSKKEVLFDDDHGE